MGGQSGATGISAALRLQSTLQRPARGRPTRAITDTRPFRRAVEGLRCRFTWLDLAAYQGAIWRSMTPRRQLVRRRLLSLLVVASVQDAWGCLQLGLAAAA